MRRALTPLVGGVLGLALLVAVAAGLLPTGAVLVLGVGLFLLLLLAGRHGMALSMLGGFVLPGLLAATVWSLGD